MLTLILSLCIAQPPAFDIRPGFVVAAQVQVQAERVAAAVPAPTTAVPSTASDRPASWPAGVPWFSGMREYRKASHSQRIVILNERDDNRWQHVEADDHFSNAPTVINPNRQFPWRSPGGLDHCSGCSNRTYIFTPAGSTIATETRYVPIPNAQRPLPRHFWTHPDGTVLADELVNERGETFEVRLREKHAGRWHNFRYGPRPQPSTPHVATRYTAPLTSDVLNRHGVVEAEYRVRTVADLRGAAWDRLPLEITYVDGKLTPARYLGPGLHCNTCHVHSGSTSYGIAVRGGGDGDFSFSPYESLTSPSLTD